MLRVLHMVSIAGLLTLAGPSCLLKEQPTTNTTAFGANASPTLIPSGAELSQKNQQMAFCSPLKLRHGDSLTINLPMPHGPDLAIISPNGTYYFIAFLQPDRESPVQPIFKAEEFKNMTQVKLVTTEAKGVPWVNEKNLNGTPEIIFKGTGRYRVLLSQSLETEDPILDGSCDIEYINTANTK